MRRLAILGASGHGKVVAEAALLAGWTSVVLFDDAYPKLKQSGEWMVAGTAEDLIRNRKEFDGFVVAIGRNTTRIARHRDLVKAGLAPATVIHPSATVSRSARLGAGSVVFAGAVINADAHLGAACIVNTSASVDHDCALQDGVHVSPGAHLGGDVGVGEATWIGIGAAVRQGIRIGAGALVAAGAAVVHDVPDGVTVAGIPARPLEDGRAR